MSCVLFPVKFYDCDCMIMNMGVLCLCLLYMPAGVVPVTASATDNPVRELGLWQDCGKVFASWLQTSRPCPHGKKVSCLRRPVFGNIFILVELNTPPALLLVSWGSLRARIFFGGLSWFSHRGQVDMFVGLWQEHTYVYNLHMVFGLTV